MKSLPFAMTLACSLLQAADPQAWTWPPVISIGIEDLKPGRAAAHKKNEVEWTRVLASAKFPAHFFGMNVVAGPNQVWWVSPAGSIAETEKGDQFLDKDPALKAKVEALAAKDGEFLSGSRSELYALRPDLSRGPGAIAPRYYWVFVIRTRPGKEMEFAAIGAKMNAYYDKAGLTARWGIYQGVGGTSNPTFMVVVPLHTLADLDAMLAEERKFAEAAGMEGLKELSQLGAEATGREDGLILAVDPKMSYPGPDTVKGDPEFWKDWTAAPAKPAAKPAKK